VSPLFDPASVVDSWTPLLFLPTLSTENLTDTIPQRPCHCRKWLIFKDFLTRAEIPRSPLCGFLTFPQPHPFIQFLIVAILATHFLEELLIVEEQISARQQRAAKAIQCVLTTPAGNAYGDYLVKSASGKEYRVAMRGPSLFENFCSCADFAVNTLGTCKHIEALLL
jgi:SWIM zinc finger